MINNKPPFFSTDGILILISFIANLALIGWVLWIICLYNQQLYADTPKNHHTEKYYQNQIHKQTGGQKEYVLDNGTRVDILTDIEAIEVDFAHKWYEAIGQSIYYAVKTNRNPVIYLIKESSHDDVYINRCKWLCKNYIVIILVKSNKQIEVRVYDATN